MNTSGSILAQYAARNEQMAPLFSAQPQQMQPAQLPQMQPSQLPQMQPSQLPQMQSAQLPQMPHAASLNVQLMQQQQPLLDTLLPPQRRQAPMRRVLIRFADMSEMGREQFMISKAIMPVEHQPMDKRIPTPSAKGTISKSMWSQMMYYIQYVLFQIDLKKSNLFASFHASGDVLTIVFNCQSTGVSVMYDFRLYCVDCWMLCDTYMRKSFHFDTWGHLDFAIVDAIKHARRMIGEVLKQTLETTTWVDQGILYFTQPTINRGSGYRDNGDASSSYGDIETRHLQRSGGSGRSRGRSQSPSNSSASDSGSESARSSSDSSASGGRQMRGQRARSRNGKAVVGHGGRR
jgi:hypothetical protein